MEPVSSPLSGGSTPYSFASTSASRRNSLSYSEKSPTEDIPLTPGFAGLYSLKSFSDFSSRVSLLPMPVVTSAATSALDAVKSSLRWLPPMSPGLAPSYSPLSVFSNGRAQPPTPRLQQILRSCLYRRLFLWIGTLCTLIFVGLMMRRTQTESNQPEGKTDAKPSLDSVWLNYTRLDSYFNGIRTIVPVEEYKPEYPTLEDQERAWQDERNETSYATIVVDVSSSGIAKRSNDAPIPTPKPFKHETPYNKSTKYYPVHQCYLDAAGKVPVPDILAYSGVPQGQPKPLMGSHSVLGMREDVCFDRFTRYGPYGLGYSEEEGGTGLGLDTEREGFEAVWASSPSGKINYAGIDWAAAQKRCLEANKERFFSQGDRRKGTTAAGASEYTGLGGELHMKRSGSEVGATSSFSNSTASLREKIDRIAVVIRCYAGFKWTPHAVLNFRALISEVSLQSGGEYDVHILLHARDDQIPVWADSEVSDEFIAQNIPAEFRGLVTLWSEPQMRLLYPTLKNDPVFSNPSGHDIHGVYRSPHLPLQHFAMQHPEYAHFWNWEMDMRFLGSYYEFFDRLDKWSASQMRRRIWDRAAKYYIPALHGSWENFTARVDAEAHEAGRPSILGNMMFAGREPTRDELNGFSPLPESGCEGAVLSTYNRTASEHNGTTPRRFFADRNNNYTNIPDECGVGEAADLITLNPLFDSDDSGWFFADDVTGYNLDFAIPPRRTAIITASRLSRRLLVAMHEETWRLRHGMFAEMFPPSVALHRGFKATYVPHPVYADRKWPLAAAERAFNSGPDHSSGGSHDSPFLPENEHNHRGLSWYYNANFAGRLWRRWLGFPQPIDDPELHKPTKEEEEKKKQEAKDNKEPTPDPSVMMAKMFEGLGGGSGEEEIHSGRMCLRSMLVHPIKFEALEEVMPS